MKREGDLLILDGLEGNPRADSLSWLQDLLAQNLDLIKSFYILLFWGTALFLLVSYIMIPLIKKCRISKQGVN